MSGDDDIYKWYVYASGNCAFVFLGGANWNGCAPVRAALDTLACTARVTKQWARGLVAPACRAIGLRGLFVHPLCLFGAKKRALIVIN